MIITKKALPRRTFLRGMGASLALPLLDAMVPSMTALAQTPANPVRRLGFIYIPMGCDIARWTPPGDGKITDLSPSLQSLEPVLDGIFRATEEEASMGRRAACPTAQEVSLMFTMEEGDNAVPALPVEAAGARLGAEHPPKPLIGEGPTGARAT